MNASLHAIIKTNKTHTLTLWQRFLPSGWRWCAE